MSVFNDKHFAFLENACMDRFVHIDFFPFSLNMIKKKNGCQHISPFVSFLLALLRNNLLRHTQCVCALCMLEVVFVRMRTSYVCMRVARLYFVIYLVTSE